MAARVRKMRAEIVIRFGEGSSITLSTSKEKEITHEDLQHFLTLAQEQLTIARGGKPEKGATS